MATKIGNFSVTSTGSKSVTGIPFLAQRIRFYAAQKSGTSEAFAHLSIGDADGNNQMAHSIADSTQSFFDRCVHHRSKVSGTWQDVLVATFTSVDDNGGGDYGFTINVSTLANGPQKIYYVAED